MTTPYDNVDIIPAVLIETLWNVNEFARRQESQIPGINRNIVECKSNLSLKAMLFMLY